MSRLGRSLPWGRDIFVAVACLAGHGAAGNGRGRSPLDVEITHKPSGQPEPVVTAGAQEVERQPGVTRMRSQFRTLSATS